jgi:DNA-binding HxlR family transcriptional regulator
MLKYGQFCPVAQALEVIGERWSLLIVRELMCGNYRFNELLYGLPLISRSLLAQRLKTLEEASVIERKQRENGKTHEYQLTPAGRELRAVVDGLGQWGKRWAGRSQADQLDPVLLMWDVRRGFESEAIPEQSTMVMFWFRDVPGKKSRYWLRLQRPEVELCLTNPGGEPELTVETTLRTMVDVWMGDRKLQEALASGAIELKGPALLTRSFPSWLMLNPLAPVERVAS